MKPALPIAFGQTTAFTSILALALSGAAHALPADQVFERAAPNLWALRTLEAGNQAGNRGSAVAIAAGKAVTSCSLLARARGIELHRDKTVHAATLEFPDAARDLCQLDVPGLLAQEPPHAAPRMGQRVYAIGYERGTELSITEGLFSRVREAGSDAERIQTSVPTSGGLLGAGLYDEEARLLGLVTLSPRDASGVVSALPARWLTELADRGRAALAGRAHDADPGLVLALVAPGIPISGKVERFTHWEPGDKATYNWVLNNKAQQIEELWNSDTGREILGVQKLGGREIPLVVTKSPYLVQKRMCISTGQACTFFPGQNVLDLPLERGKQWTTHFTVSSATATARVSEVHWVEKIEKVTVPAGEFEAFKITITSRARGRITSGFGGGSAFNITGAVTQWLAFVAGKPVWVKRIYTNSNGDRATLELVSTSIK
jgi:hypothetical protein